MRPCYAVSMLRFFFILTVFFSSCSSPPESSKKTVYITGREPERVHLYRVKVPSDWNVIEPEKDISLSDSRIPLLEILIHQKIRITIHNFPVLSLEERIPPQAQVQRWLGQLSSIDKTNTIVTPQSFSGYTGLRLEACGKSKGQDVSVIAWALQLGKEHFRTLLYKKNFPEQLRADVTIKITGPPGPVNKSRNAIFQFAKSFELIEEIPPPR